MKEQCFDEGTIQAFLDGELSSDLLENVARHVASCEPCALLLSEAEQESAFAFNVLDEELNTLVPTERIRTNLFQAISQIQEPRVSFWQKAWSFVVLLSNPRVAAFASLLVILGIFAAVISLRNQPTPVPTIEIATAKSTPTVEPVVTNSNPIPQPTIEVAPTIQKIVAPKFEKVIYKHESKVENQKPKIAEYKKPTTDHRPLTTENIDGEITYLKTIATLENTIKDKKDNILRASSRVSYERDMAVVEDSIKRMKAEVRRNPKNEAAKQVLRNSYQNKIELLNSVSDRSEFMASLN